MLYAGISILVISIILAAGTSIYDKKAKLNKDDWLLYRFADKLYYLLFRNKKEEDVMNSSALFRLDRVEYQRLFALSGTDFSYRDLIICRTAALFFLAGAGISLFFISTSFAMILSVLSAVCMYGPKARLKYLAEKRRAQMEEEFPEFLELLSIAVRSGMSTNQAILFLGENSHTLVSEEFRQAFCKTKYGALSWEEALCNIANKYDIPMLNSLVSKVVVSSEHGTDLGKAIDTFSDDIWQENIRHIKEKADRTDVILNLVPFFSILIMLVIIMLPAYEKMGGL